MNCNKRTVYYLLIISVFAITTFKPIVVTAADLSMDIYQAKSAIDRARIAGAESNALDDLSQARSWLGQAEREYARSQSLWSRGVKLVMSDEAKIREIQYLASMAKIRSQIAEAKSLKATVSLELINMQKELADYQGTLDVLNKKLAETELARKIKAQAEAQQKEMEQAHQKAVALESKKAKELEEAKKKLADLEALKQKELEEVNSKGQQLASQKAKEEEEFKTLQQKVAQLDKIKAMMADASKISDVTVKPLDTGVLINIAASNIFSVKNDIHVRGRSILDQVAGYLDKYSTGTITINCYTDNVGKADKNRVLTEQRAQKVKAYLVDFHNIVADRIFIRGLGSSQPIVENNTAAGRAQNRRIEIGVTVDQ